MKKIMLPLLAVSAINVYSQTVTTTTINGSLRVNDSLNVTNNLQAEGITSRGEMVAKEAVYAEKDIFVDGNASINGNLDVKGLSNLQAGVVTSELLLGTTANHTKITSITSGSAHRVYFGPLTNQSSNIVCIPPYNYGTAIFPDRITIPPNSSTYVDNQLDFRNDGLTGFIEFGHNSTGNPPGPQMRQGTPVINTTWPTLKVNSLCNGNVEIAFGGGTLSTGKFFEVGFPDRDFKVASNIFADGIKTGQRITTLHPLNAVPGHTLYNTQLVVNTAITRALAISNNGTNAQGDEVFTVFGDGKTHIGKGRPLSGGPIANAMLTVDGVVVAKEVKVTVSAAYWADYVFEKDYKLMPLNELKLFIHEHGHLPNVPSTEEITATGNDLGKTDAVLLAKIEECMLYIMELDKKVNELQKENSELKSKNQK